VLNNATLNDAIEVKRGIATSKKCLLLITKKAIEGTNSVFLWHFKFAILK
jgi:hypothetical protein